MSCRRVGLGFILPGLLAGLLAFLGCSKAPPPWGGAPAPRVVVTIPALYSFVKNVAGDRGAIRCLCTTTGPHHYDPDTTDRSLLRGASLFLANGSGLDDKFANPLHDERETSQVPYFRLSEGLGKLRLKNEDHDEDEKDAKEGHHDEHSHGEFDPHVWLGIEQAKHMVDQIRDKLSEVDSDHAGEYVANARKYNGKLDKLLAEGKKKLEGKKSRKLIAFHDSLEYFARSFDLKIVDVIEKAPGETPTGPELQKLKGLCKKDDGPRVIAVEPQYASNTSAELLKKEVGDKIAIIVVDPLETADAGELGDPRWYENHIRTNIDNLVKALP